MTGGMAGRAKPDFFVSYAAPNRDWAEWIAWQVEDVGFRVLLQDWDNVPGSNWLGAMQDAVQYATRTIAVLSPAYLASVYGAAEWQAAWRVDPDGQTRKLLPVRIAECERPGLLAGVVSVDLFGTTEPEARRRLHAAVDAALRGRGKPTERPPYPGRKPPATAARTERDRPRFPLTTAMSPSTRLPGSEPTWIQAPTRNARFTGREAELQRLRRELHALGRTLRPVALVGAGGTGKTQLALEYVHRFRSDYDLVWWVHADSPELVDIGLAELGVQLRLPSEDTASGGAWSTLEALCEGNPTARWILVLDNADGLAHLQGFFSRPCRAGRLMVTSRTTQWPDGVPVIHVGAFRREESIRHLRIRSNGLSARQADEVARTLGDLPIAVATAGALLAETGTPVDEFLRAVKQHGVGTHAVQATWDLALQRLREVYPGAHVLLQICSVLASEIALELLYSEHFVSTLVPFEPSLTVGDMRGVLVQQLNRLSMVRVDTAAARVHVHRMLQEAVRRRMSEQDSVRTRHEVHLALAAFRPSGEPDDPRTWDRFQTIWPHLEASDAVSCFDGRVRQLVIDRVRYLWRRGELTQGRDLGESVLAAWTTRLAGVDAGGQEKTPLPRWRATSLRRQRLLLHFTLSNIYREQADFTAALQCDEEVRTAQLALLGDRDLHTLMTSGGLAADYRAVGRYSEALALDEVTHRTLRDYFGEDHPRTLAAANNLAASHRAVGDFRTAMRLDTEVLDRRWIVLGPVHPYTLHSQACLARDLREAGEYGRSVDILLGVHSSSIDNLGTDALGTLTAQASLAVSLRYMGRAQDAAALLDEAYERLRSRFGEDNPNTLACRLNRATNLLATDDVSTALEELGEVTGRYRRSLGERHPFSLVCLANEAGARRRQGDHIRAAELAGQVARGFRTSVGEGHPYHLAALFNDIVCRHDSGEIVDVGDELALLEATMVDVLGARHPDTLVCWGHLGVIRGAAHLTQEHSEWPSGPAAAIDDLEARLGTNHPTVAHLRAGKLVYRLLDPHDPF